MSKLRSIRPIARIGDRQTQCHFSSRGGRVIALAASPASSRAARSSRQMPLVSIGGFRLIRLLQRARGLPNRAVLLLAVRPLLREALPPTARWKTDDRAHLGAVPTPPRSSSTRGGPSAPVGAGEEASTLSSEIPRLHFFCESLHRCESFF
jgi:hypothetical protein